MEQPEQKIKLTLPETSTDAAGKQDDSFTGTSIFDAKNVSIYYSAFRAVTDVSLTIYENEITAFIGPSGCGKTTVLRTLNRMNDLIVGARVEGDIHYRGASLYESSVSPTAVRRRIGMVFQKPNPFPKSIYDNVAYGPRINGIRGKEQARRDRRAVAAAGRPVGRGEGPAEQVRPWACPAASSSACASPARSRSSPTSSSWTSPARPSTRSRPAGSRT